MVELKVLGWRRFTECFAGINIWFIRSERLLSFLSGWWKQKDGCCPLGEFVLSSNPKLTLQKWEVPGNIFCSFLHHFFNLTHILFYGIEKETLAIKCQMPPLTYHFFFFFSLSFPFFSPFLSFVCLWCTSRNFVRVLGIPIWVFTSFLKHCLCL